MSNLENKMTGAMVDTLYLSTLATWRSTAGPTTRMIQKTLMGGRRAYQVRDDHNGEWAPGRDPRQESPGAECDSCGKRALAGRSPGHRFGALHCPVRLAGSAWAPRTYRFCAACASDFDATGGV